MTERNENLNEVIDERVKVYGDPTVTFPQIAAVWSGYLGFEVQPEDVPMMMILMKSVRARQAPDYSDNTDDIEGYLDIYRKLVPGMIHARSVDEYVSKKFPRLTVPGLAPEPQPNQLTPFELEIQTCIANGVHRLSNRHTWQDCNQPQNLRHNERPINPPDHRHLYQAVACAISGCREGMVATPGSS